MRKWIVITLLLAGCATTPVPPGVQSDDPAILRHVPAHNYPKPR